MLRRILHHNTGTCHANNCSKEAYDHNKIYWHDGIDAIHSAHYCRNCYNQILSPHWFRMYANWGASPKSNEHNFATLKACKLDLITKALTDEKR